MKKTLIYSSLVLLLSAMACNKTESTVSEEPIRFAFATDATRTLVENNTGLQAQTLKVYDDMGATSYYIDDAVKYNSGTWDFISEHAYTWRTGNHKFFAYTDGAGTLDAEKKLTVSKTLTTADANQVDLLYSDIVNKTEADAGSPVKIYMNHLFAAVGIMVKNATSGEVTVNSVSATGIKDNGSATIDFSGTTTAITYRTVTTSGSFISGTLSDETLAANGLADVLGQAAAEANTFWLVWPQAVAAEALTATIEYTIGTKTYTSELKFPADAVEDGWKAGYKYLYTININPHDIRLEFTVTKWVENEGENIIVE